jgi:hypothetical protein
MLIRINDKVYNTSIIEQISSADTNIFNKKDKYQRIIFFFKKSCDIPPLHIYVEFLEYETFLWDLSHNESDLIELCCTDLEGALKDQEKYIEKSQEYLGNGQANLYYYYDKGEFPEHEIESIKVWTRTGDKPDNSYKMVQEFHKKIDYLNEWIPRVREIFYDDKNGNVGTLKYYFIKSNVPNEVKAPNELWINDNNIFIELETLA